LIFHPNYSSFYPELFNLPQPVIHPCFPYGLSLPLSNHNTTKLMINLTNTDLRVIYHIISWSFITALLLGFMYKALLCLFCWIRGLRGCRAASLSPFRGRSCASLHPRHLNIHVLRLRDIRPSWPKLAMTFFWDGCVGYGV